MNTIVEQITRELKRLEVLCQGYLLAYSGLQCEPAGDGPDIVKILDSDISALYDGRRVLDRLRVTESANFIPYHEENIWAIIEEFEIE